MLVHIYFYAIIYWCYRLALVCVIYTISMWYILNLWCKLFKEQIRKLEISNEATSLGTSAFEDCRSLGEVHIGLNVLDIYKNVFAGCKRLYHIYSYPTYPPFADITSFANYSADVHIPCESNEWYVRDVVWGKFNILCLGADVEDVPEGEVTTTTTNTSVTITWPTDENADTYTIEIKKGDVVFCTLTFNNFSQCFI